MGNSRELLGWAWLYNWRNYWKNVRHYLWDFKKYLGICPEDILNGFQAHHTVLYWFMFCLVKSCCFAVSMPSYNLIESPWSKISICPLFSITLKNYCWGLWENISGNYGEIKFSLSIQTFCAFYGYFKMLERKFQMEFKLVGIKLQCLKIYVECLWRMWNIWGLRNKFSKERILIWISLLGCKCLSLFPMIFDLMTCMGGGFLSKYSCKWLY